MKPVLLVPGINNSGSAHWQSIWEARHAKIQRVMQRDWDYPNCDEWVEALDVAVRLANEPPIIVAHSLGCLVVARWAARSNQAVHAVLLVAVPDPEGSAFPREATGFSPVTTELRNELRGKRITIISSTDDPYSTPAYTLQRVAQWNAEHISLASCGHINAVSGLDDWADGWSIVEQWRNE
jgi:predicted alpha/beta hydrolase family esterase